MSNVKMFDCGYVVFDTLKNLQEIILDQSVGNTL